MLLRRIGRCTITHQIYGCTTACSNELNACIATSWLKAGPCRYLALENVDEYTNLCVDHALRIFSLLHILSSNCEKEKAYENWVDRVSWTKSNLSWEETEKRHRLWIFFHVSSSNSHTSFVKGLVLTTIHLGSYFLTICTLSWRVFILVFTLSRLLDN